MIPSSITTRYHHAGCCEQYAGMLVELHSIVHAETGSYVPAPAPRCVVSQAELRQDGPALATYGRG